MTLFHALGLHAARSIALCGAGGKTTLLYALAEQARRQNNRVFVTTSTHMFQPKRTDHLRFYDPSRWDTVASAAIPSQISVFGTPCGNKKITGLHPMMVPAAMQATDFFLYEADGSRRLPVKCHNHTEPVLWPGTDAVVCVLGLSACGKAAQQVCHRWQLDQIFSHHPQKLLDSDDFVRLALECRAAANQPHQFSVCLNQCDTPALLAVAQSAAQQLREYGIVCAATCLLHDSPESTAL